MKQACAQRYKYILAEGEEPAHDGLRIALLHGRQSGVLLHDPEEHNTGGKCAQRAKVNGYHIHPLRGPGWIVKAIATPIMWITAVAVTRLKCNFS